MAEMKEAPADAPMVVKVMTWLDNRFPTLFDEYRKHMSEYYAPKNFNFWYFFGSLAMLVLVIQIVTGIFPDDALQARCRHRVRLGRVHHARRAGRLDHPLHALHRGQRVLHRRLPAHVPRADLRQLPQAA